MTRAPWAAAISAEPSLEPLSATSTSPSIPARCRKPCAFVTQAPTVAASSRQGRFVLPQMNMERAAGEEAVVGGRIEFHAALSGLERVLDPPGVQVLAAR